VSYTLGYESTRVVTVNGGGELGEGAVISPRWTKCDVWGPEIVFRLREADFEVFNHFCVKFSFIRVQRPFYQVQARA
jgi:hypothetical protein